MQLKSLMKDDDAVSPVIGVILMVAITVILAAVIASFVLGLGDDAANTSPTASFTTDYEADGDADGDGYLTVTHDGGNAISESEIYIRGDFGTDAGSSAGSWAELGNTTSGDDSKVVAGDYAELEVGSDYDIRVVWESAEGDSSSTLAEGTGPDA